MTSNEVIRPPEPGCYVDGWWGQYAPARVIQLAGTTGMPDHALINLANAKINSMGTNPHNIELSVDDEEAIVEGSDRAIEWLNENVCQDGYSWGWHDGEFFYQSTEWWAE